MLTSRGATGVGAASTWPASAKRDACAGRPSASERAAIAGSAGGASTPAIQPIDAGLPAQSVSHCHDVCLDKCRVPQRVYAARTAPLGAALCECTVERRPRINANWAAAYPPVALCSMCKPPWSDIPVQNLRRTQQSFRQAGSEEDAAGRPETLTGDAELAVAADAVHGPQAGDAAVAGAAAGAGAGPRARRHTVIDDLCNASPESGPGSALGSGSQHLNRSSCCCRYGELTQVLTPYCDDTPRPGILDEECHTFYWLSFAA